MNKKMPMRKCLGCGEMFPQKQLVRVVKTRIKGEDEESFEISLNLVGKKTRKGSGGGGGGGSDAPEGYGNFITADDMVFAASDSKFYVEL